MASRASAGTRAPWVVQRRAYEPATRGGGYRVLVDRLWPRGVSKSALALDVWARELAPSAALRRWYGHDPARWREFARRYRAELRASDEARRWLGELARRARSGRVTLVHGARDTEHSNSAVLAAEIERRARTAPRTRTATTRAATKGTATRRGAAKHGAERSRVRRRAAHRAS